MAVLGRRSGGGPTAHLGRYRAWDGSVGAQVDLDLTGPHVIVIVGKRGAGKSHTLGVLAEELRTAPGVAPVVLDPMAAVGDPEAGDPVRPQVRADAIPPDAWPGLLGLNETDPAGTLVWRAAAETETLAGLRSFVNDAAAPAPARRAAANHLQLAASWEIFDSGGLSGDDLRTGGGVLDVSRLGAAPINAIGRAVGGAIFQSCRRRDGPLPWLLLDEAHVLFEGVARPAIEQLLRRGRQPGVSLVMATQRPAAVPDLAISQADVLLAHRLTGEADRARLEAARPAYLSEALSTRLPEAPGEALVIDDATECAHPITVRERDGVHPGESPRVSDTAEVSGPATD